MSIALSHPIAPCLWFDNQAEEAANFYVSVFANSKITSMSRYPGGLDMPAGAPPMPAGTPLAVYFELNGQPFMALNGGPIFAFSEAISLVITCETQAEIDHYWDALLVGGGAESVCGWLKDRYGLSWQITPAVMETLLAGPKAREVMQAMFGMVKMDIAGLEAAAKV